MRYWLALFLGFVFSCALATAPVEAGSLRMHGTGSAPPSPECIKSLNVTGCEEGVLAGGLYFATGDGEPGGTPGWTAFSAMARQTGQSAYAVEPDINLPGIDFGIGPNLLDSAMTPVQDLATNEINYCSAASGINFVCTPPTSCPGGSVEITVENILFAGVRFVGNNADGCGKYILRNNTFTTDFASCLYGRSNNGEDFVGYFGGVGNAEFYNNRVVNSRFCNPASNMWGSPAGAGAGMEALATFTGVMSTGTASPGEVTVGSCIGDCIISRFSHIDYPGRHIGTTPPDYADENQILWITKSLATCAISGTALTCSSFDVRLRTSLVVGEFLFWNNAASGQAKTGIYIAACSSGTACTLNASAGTVTSRAMGTGIQYCENTDCIGAIIQTQRDEDSSGLPVDITAGPLLGGPAQFNIGQGDYTCGIVKSRNNFFHRTSINYLSKSNCAFDSQNDYQVRQVAQLGYATNQSGAPHVMSINQLDDSNDTNVKVGGIEQMCQQNNVIWTNKWNGTGSNTTMHGQFTTSGFANILSGGWMVRYAKACSNNNVEIYNKTVNDFTGDDVPVAESGYLVRYLGQSGVDAATFTASVAPNGDGITSTMTVTAVSAGTLVEGDFPQCSDCRPANPGQPMRIEAYGTGSTTGVGNTGTYIVNGQFIVSSKAFTTERYPGQIDLLESKNNYRDDFGVGNCGVQTENYTIFNSLDVSNNINLRTGGAC